MPPKKSESSKPMVSLSNTFSSLASQESDNTNDIILSVTSRMNEQEKEISTIRDQLKEIISLLSSSKGLSHNDNITNKHSNMSGNEQSLQPDNETSDDIDELIIDDHKDGNHSTSTNSSDKFSTPRTVAASATSGGREDRGRIGLPAAHSFPVNQTLSLASSSSPTVPSNSSNNSIDNSATTVSPPLPSSVSLTNPFISFGNGSSKLPALKEIPISGMTVDQYIEWRRKLLHNVSTAPKYNFILTREPEDSWKLFKDTYAHLPLNMIEKGYLDTHQVLSAYIQGAIPNTVEVVINSKMKDDESEYDLSTILNLSVKGDYNAYALLELLDAQYITRTNHRLQEVIHKLRELKYSGTEDPKIFIGQFRELHNQGKLLIPCWPTYDEQFLAHDILDRLSSQFDMTKTLIMSRGHDHPKSVTEVEEALQLWWIRKNGKGTIAGHSSNTPNSGYSGNRRRTPYTSTPTSGTTNVNYVSHHTNNGRKGNHHHYDNNKNANANNSNNDHNDDHDPNVLLGCVFASRVDESKEVTSAFAGSAIADEYTPGSNDLLFDTGAAISITGQKNLLHEEETTDKIRVSGFTGGHGVISDKRGILKLSSKVSLNNVRYVPSCTYSLMSVGQVTKKGHTVVFTHEGAYVLQPKFFTASDVNRMKENSILTALKIGSLYVREISKKAAVEKQLDEENQLVYKPNASSGKIPKTKFHDKNNKNIAIPSSQPSSSVNVNNVSNHNESNNPSPPISDNCSNYCDKEDDSDGEY